MKLAFGSNSELGLCVRLIGQSSQLPNQHIVSCEKCIGNKKYMRESLYSLYYKRIIVCKILLFWSRLVRAFAYCLHYPTKHSNLHLIGRLQFPWLTDMLSLWSCLHSTGGDKKGGFLTGIEIDYRLFLLSRFDWV